MLNAPLSRNPKTAGSFPGGSSSFALCTSAVASVNRSSAFSRDGSMRTKPIDFISVTVNDNVLQPLAKPVAALGSVTPNRGRGHTAAHHPALSLLAGSPLLP